MTENAAYARRLEGKIALVTGGSRGIGLAVARRLVTEGAKVCITARSADGLAAVASLFEPDTVLTVAGKAHDTKHRRAALDEIAARFGRLDIIVNNAGTNPVYGPLMHLDLDAARKINDVNTLASLGWIQGAYHHDVLKMATRGGAVVNLSSVTGQTPSPGIGFYGVSKAAVAHLTRTLAVEMAPRIRVNAVAPAVVKTQFAKALYHGKEDEVVARYPMGRLGTPEDIAAAVAFLVSPDAAWITGQILTVDGGLISAGGVA